MSGGWDPGESGSEDDLLLSSSSGTAWDGSHEGSVDGGAGAHPPSPSHAPPAAGMGWAGSLDHREGSFEGDAGARPRSLSPSHAPPTAGMGWGDSLDPHEESELRWYMERSAVDAGARPPSLSPSHAPPTARMGWGDSLNPHEESELRWYMERSAVGDAGSPRPPSPGFSWNIDAEAFSPADRMADLSGGPFTRGVLNPDARPFSPPYAPSADKVNITDEVLGTFSWNLEAEPFSPANLARRMDSGEEIGEGHHPPTTSTPVVARGRPRTRISPVRSRGPRLSARDWSYMPGRRNRRRRRNLQKKILYSDEGEISVPEEHNKKKTGLRWRRKGPRSLKFVDDSMLVSKVNMDSAPESLSVGKPIKSKHDIESQNVFRRMVRRAEERGMVVNNAKTKVLCVSDAQTYKAEAYLKDCDGADIKSSGSMKVLGYHMDSRPSCHAHVRALQVRMRDTTWVLRHLKLAGFTEQELAKVYRTVVRPILDYCAVIYHPMLTDDQDQVVERLQARALKNIYGYRDSYAVMRKKAGVTTHRQRRIELCDKFARKAASNPTFERWFPLRQGRSGRHAETYREFQARTDRLFNSPLFYFRRRLNGKKGKEFGLRNREYREER